MLSPWGQIELPFSCPLHPPGGPGTMARTMTPFPGGLLPPAQAAHADQEDL